MRIRREAGEFIFREGDPANRFYLIEEGRVCLESPPYYWHFDARVVEPTTAIFFYGTRLREQCEQDPDFGYEMMKRMTQVVIHRLQARRKELLLLRR